MDRPLVHHTIHSNTLHSLKTDNLSLSKRVFGLYEGNWTMQTHLKGVERKGVVVSLQCHVIMSPGCNDIDVNLTLLPFFFLARNDFQLSDHVFNPVLLA